MRDLEKQWISALIRVERPLIDRLRGSGFASEVAGDQSDPVPPWLLASAALPGRGTWIESNLIVDDVTVRAEGDAAVVTSMQTYHPPPSGQPSLEPRQRFYEVEDHWQKRAGRWQVVRRVVRPI
ncbi:MAG: nuclear transport factor 2 family protein [Thermoanaerobaculia bacterium]|nr:nuclear transport factor 2 family protein [Thermoanaerobaculia bacterium]